MDWVAFLIMGKEATQSIVTTRGPKILKDHLNIAEKFHKSRIDYQNDQYKKKPAQHTNVIYRAKGKRTAELMYNFIKRCITDEYKSWEKFLRISFELNITESTNNKLEKFVATLDYYLNDFFEDWPREMQKAKLRSAIKKYAEDNNHDVNKLYHCVLETPLPKDLEIVT
jgi:hypothetical protein